MQIDKLDRKHIILSTINLLFVIILSTYFIYKIQNPILNFICYSLIFILFILSNNLVKWTVILFVLLINPWGLFYYYPYEWYINLTSTVGISYKTLFGIVFLIKIYYLKKKQGYIIKDYLKSYYFPVAGYAIFMLFWGLAFGYNAGAIYNLIQYLPSFLLFVSVPILLNFSEQKIFNGILFLFSIVHFILSLVEIIYPGSFMPIIFFGNPPIGVMHTETLTRFVGGITIHLYVMIIGLFYIAQGSKPFKKWYLWLVVLLSYIFIINSATRGWMISSSVLLLLFFIYNLFSRRVNAASVFSLVLVLLLIIIFIPDSFKKNIDAAFQRLETVEAIAEGDATAVGTLSRLTERGPIVLSRYSESPIFGFGYSKVTATLYDDHVGNHDLLLMGGALGLAILWLTALGIIWFFFIKDFQYPQNGFYVLGLGVISILIIHSTSRAMVSYYIPVDAAFIIALLFNHFNALFTLQKNVK